MSINSQFLTSLNISRNCHNSKILTKKYIYLGFSCNLNIMKMKLFIYSFALLAILAYSPIIKSETISIPKIDWSFNGPFGSFDKAQLQRGFSVYRQVCSSCHSLKNVSFRHLKDLGYDDSDIKAIASEYLIEDGPDGAGDFFTRKAISSDNIPAPYINDNQARFANNGAFPVNLSTIIKARSGGADYVAALLTGYVDNPPVDIKIEDDQYYNQYFKGNVIAMSQQLSDDLIEYTDGSPVSKEQYAKDVTAFLAWANEPHMIERKQLGLKVILFLTLFLVIAIFYQRKLWRRIKI